VYVPLGGGQYTLFRWLGTVFVFLLALLVAAATVLTDERLLPDFDGGWSSVAGFALIVVFSALCLAAIPANFATIGAGDVPSDGVEVRDYVVTYDEDVRNAYVDSIPLPERARQNITESGVIVASDDREIWTTVVEPNRLSVNGRQSVVLGGVGWRETVTVNRVGWAVSGNDSVYRVALSREAQPPQTTFRSSPSTADGTIAGRNVTFRPAGNGFEIAVRRNGETVDTGPVPENMSSERIGGLTFERNRSRLYAAGNGTRVPIARAQGT